MVDISRLIDKRIDETFKIKAPKSYTANSTVRKTKVSSLPPQTGRPKNTLTPKLNIKEERSLLIRAAKTRGESHENYRSDASTTQAATGKNLTDPWKTHKRLALLQHPLWVECMKSWWNVMDPHDISIQESGTDGKITMEQYLDLNVRLQKTLNPEFVYDNACISAVEDWEVDADDWDSTVSIGETQHPCTPSSNYAPSVVKDTQKSFSFDKFSEFLFEIGEVWCDGSIESILVLVNSALLHISQGVHLCSSVFKDIETITTLPVILFQEMSDMALNNAPQNLEFIKWYQRNFLETSSMREYVTGRLYRIMPFESRVADLWIAEQGYNQTEVLIQCTTRLESLLNRIQRSAPVALPITENGSKRKIMQNALIKPISTAESGSKANSTKRSVVPKLPAIRPQENEPIVGLNKIMFTRNVNLALLGQAYSNRRGSQELNESVKPEIHVAYSVSKDIVVPNVSQLKPAVSQKIGTDLSPQVTERSITYEQLFHDSGSKRPYSTPIHGLIKTHFVRSNSYLLLHHEEKKLFEENLDPEYTPKLKFNKTDVKYHKLEKSWRKGKFSKHYLKQGSPEVGEVNKKSPLEYYESKIKHGKELVRNYEYNRNSKTQDYSRSQGEKASPSHNDIVEKKDSMGSDDIERLVGIKIEVNTPYKVNKSMKTTQNIEGKVAQTAPPLQTRKVDQRTVSPKYTFEEYSHLVKPNKHQKLVFKDSLEFLYALNQAKYEFNQTHQSEFLKNYNKNQNEYRSRRDELGGHISSDEWKRFIMNLEEIIRITKVRRRNKKLRMKRKGKERVRRRGPNVAKNRLWRNVFIRPFNQEKMNRDKYLREVKKIDEGVKEVLPQGLEQLVNESVKIPVPPAVSKPKPKPARTYSPSRYRIAKAN